MAMSAEDIAALLQREGSSHSSDEQRDAQRRTELLSPVLTVCRDLWSSRSDDLDAVAEELGDASRNAVWRIPFGESGLLEFFIGIFSSDSLGPRLQLHALRLIGNSCADTDENRARVVEGDRLSSIIRRVSSPNTISQIIPVLYNILVDYEPAQKRASEANLSNELTNSLSLESMSSLGPFAPYICKILVLLGAQEGELDRASSLTASRLLSLSQHPTFRDDAADFLSLVAAVSLYLANETPQKTVINEDKVPQFMDVFYRVHTSISPEDVDEADMTDSFDPLKTSLLTIMSDIAAQPEFVASYSLGSPVQKALLSWLREPSTSVRTAACLALGNLARSDEASTALVHTCEAHVPLIELLGDPSTTDTQILHSALSFLKNLAIPSGNKAALGDLLDQQCVPRIYTLDSIPQVQFAAVSLTRILLIECPSNARKVCSRSSSELANGQTTISALCSLFERSDAEPVKVEAARIMSSLCRLLHSNNSEEILADWDTGAQNSEDAASSRRSLFYSQHKSIAGPLAFIIGQNKWPSLRSETWFVLALMSRSKEGGEVVASITTDPNVTAALVEAITGQSTTPEAAAARLGETASSAVVELDASASEPPSGSTRLELEPQQVEATQKADMSRADRANTIIMCQEMLRNCELSGGMATMWRDLIKEGAEMISVERGNP